MSIETHDGEAFRLNAWNYQEILADLKSRYDNPMQALGADDATELVNLAQALEPTADDHDERRDFVELLEGMDEDYKETSDGIMYNPDNTDAYLCPDPDWQLDEKYLD